MISKPLNKDDRAEIIALAKCKIVQKWNDSPLHAEAQELLIAASAIIHDRQIAIIPTKDRKVLNRYGSKTSRHTLNLQKRGKDGTISTSLRHFGSSFRMYVAVYRLKGDPPENYPSTSGEIANCISAKAPELIARYYELLDLKICEENKVVAAFTKLLNNCRTTLQVSNVAELKPFLPEYLLNYKKPDNGPLTVSETVMLSDLIADDDEKEELAAA